MKNISGWMSRALSSTGRADIKLMRTLARVLVREEVHPAFNGGDYDAQGATFLGHVLTVERPDDLNGFVVTVTSSGHRRIGAIQVLNRRGCAAQERLGDHTIIW